MKIGFSVFYIPFTACRESSISLISAMICLSLIFPVSWHHKSKKGTTESVTNSKNKFGICLLQLILVSPLSINVEGVLLSNTPSALFVDYHIIKFLSEWTFLIFVEECVYCLLREIIIKHVYPLHLGLRKAKNKVWATYTTGVPRLIHW